MSARTKLTLADLHQTRVTRATGEIPAQLLPWQDDVYGPSAVAFAVMALIRREVPLIAFAFCDRPEPGLAGVVVVREMVVGLGLTEEERTEVRYAGEGLDPDGAGSHAVIDGRSVRALDPVHIAAQLVAQAQGKAIFRLRTPERKGGAS